MLGKFENTSIGQRIKTQCNNNKNNNNLIQQALIPKLMMLTRSVHCKPLKISIVLL